MLWQLQLLLAGLMTVQYLNLLFAVLCVMAALDLPPRWVAVLSAVLYVAMAFV